MTFRPIDIYEVRRLNPADIQLSTVLGEVEAGSLAEARARAATLHGGDPVDYVVRYRCTRSVKQTEVRS
jgi:hypothetical protein